MDQELLRKFFFNHCTPPERELVISWLLNPANDALLKSWMREHWDLLNEQDYTDKPDIEKIWQRLQTDLQLTPQPQQAVAEPVRSTGRLRTFAWRYKWLAAAALLAVVAGLFVTSNRSNREAATVLETGSAIHKVNNSSQPQLLQLEDGTQVTLYAHASIDYPVHFSKDKRAVCIQGEAFFDVAKNPARPFFVHYDKLVTQVLGTSFLIRGDDAAESIEVEVRTGKVAVYDNQAKSSADNGVLLTPNQKATYYARENRFTTSLVKDPQPVVPPASLQKKNTLVFAETPMKEVLAQLEQTYQIEIIVENDDIYNCPFTGDITSYNLFQKLSLICEAIGSSYEVKGAKILIRGKGCPSS